MSLSETLAFLCSHQSALFLHKHPLSSSRSISFHGRLCIASALMAFSSWNFCFLCPCIWSSLDADLLFKENWSISQVDYCGAGVPKNLQNTVLSGNQTVPWKGISFKAERARIWEFQMICGKHTRFIWPTTWIPVMKRNYFSLPFLVSRRLGKSTK